MIVECTCQTLSAAQGATLGADFSTERSARLQVGRRYVVLGLQYESGSILWGTGAWVQIATGEAQLLVAPLALFSIVEPTPSRHWQVRSWPQGSLTLWPAPFYRAYFHADLDAGEDEATAIFEDVLRELEREAGETGRPRSTFSGWGPEGL